MNPFWLVMFSGALILCMLLFTLSAETLGYNSNDPRFTQTKRTALIGLISAAALNTVLIACTVETMTIVNLLWVAIGSASLHAGIGITCFMQGNQGRIQDMQSGSYHPRGP